MGATERRPSSMRSRGRVAAAPRSTRGSARSRDSMRPASARGFRSIPRRVSGYNLDDLLPERGFHVARALVGSEGTCAIVLDAKVTLDPQPAAPRRSSDSDTPTRSKRPITCRRFSSSHRSASRGSKARWWTACARRARPTSNCCRRDGAFFSSSSAPTIRGRRDAPPSDSSQRSKRSPDAPVDAALFGRRRSKRGLEAARVGSTRRREHSRRRRLAAKGGTTRRSRRRSSARTCASFARLLDAYGYRRRSTGTSATAASTCRSASTC